MLERIMLVVALLVLASAGYWWWQRRQGRVRPVEKAGALSSETLGAKRGFHATFVMFSTPMCAKCPGTLRLLTEVAGTQRHVAVIEVDAAAQLDLARELSIMRTPTTLVLDSDGVPVARMDGPPTREQAQAALAAVPPASTDYSI